MDLQSRKLKVIEFLINVKDEKVFDKIESNILKAKSKYNQDLDFKPMTVNQLAARIEKSEDDFRNGNFISQEDLEIESKNW